MSRITMRDRLLALLCGMLLGTALRAGWERFQAPAPEPSPPSATAQAPMPAPPAVPSRCATHPIKMPCLADQ